MVVKIAVPYKMLYRYKVGIFAGLVASITFLIAYVTVPKSTQAPEIRVLYISLSDYGAVKRMLDAASAAHPNLFVDTTLQVFKISGDGSVTIDRDEWDLQESETNDGEIEHFYENNIVLECTASFPIGWRYSGYGSPTVTEKNVRVHGNYNDSNTFTYLSLLNLMPLTEKSTGLYSCFGTSNETGHFSSSIHLFVPGDKTFVIDYDTTIEAVGEDLVFIPCPVTNASANVSLYFKNQPISTDSTDSLLTFDPKCGFVLKPKFVEQQNEPWGQFYCKDEDTNEKSGVITIQPQKGLIVNTIPESKTVFISKSKRGGSLSSTTPEEKFKFLCQAKEEITLKFLRVVANPMVHYDYNSSSTFPFSAYTEVNTRQFKNLSKIFCRTLRNNEDLHSWRVLFSSLSLQTEAMNFQYDNTREDFSCCSPTNKRAKLTAINCKSLSECRIKAQCLLPGHKCDADKVTMLPERTGCVRYRFQRSESRSLKDGGDSDKDITLESGLLQCSVDGMNTERVYFASRHSGVNGTTLSLISDEISLSATANLFELDTTSITSESYLQIVEVVSSKRKSGIKRYLCRGAKFFLAVGFLWQTVYSNNELKFHYGRDILKGEWIQSQIELPIKRISHRQGTSSTLKRVYCAAPLWNSAGEWAHAKWEMDS